LSIRRRRLVPLLALLGLGVLPCHWAPGVAQALPLGQAAQPQVVRVDLTEWALSPSRVAVAAGRPVRFIASNGGAIPHALVVEGAGVRAETPSIGSAGSARLEVTFAAPGVYDLFCPIAAGQHRLLGQDGRLAAVAAAPGATYPLTDDAADESILVAILGPGGAAAVAAAEMAPAGGAPGGAAGGAAEGTAEGAAEGTAEVAPPPEGAADAPTAAGEPDPAAAAD
jgi:plastocyanin